ncbi:MAG: apolipoprotein N-acyltransferase [Gammaproteobacteria bacterium]
MRGAPLLIILGALCVLAFAPFQWFPIAMVAPALLEKCIHHKTAKQGALKTFLFGLGFFGFGVSWVFVSIHDHSDAPLWAAIAITFLFVAALSGVLAMMGALYSAISTRTKPSRLSLLIFPLLWVLFEWVRTWLLTGFPWLLLGYTLIDTPLQSFAPVFGVYGLSFICVLMGVCFVRVFSVPRRKQGILLAGIAVLFLVGVGLKHIRWTHPVGESKVFGLVQGNIPQETKWDPSAANAHLETYRGLTNTLSTSNVIVWPEAAFPYTLPYGRKPLLMVESDALRAHQSLITGVVIAENNHMYTNSVVALGVEADGRYDKYHLVPFGEFVPFHQLLGSTFDWLQLPMSFTIPGAKIQTPLEVQGMHIVPLICYEVVYPELARLRALQSSVLLTVSNDTWFGQSLGPIQHLQMARMRALENGRMLVRATNNGMTAIVNADGTIRGLAPSHQITTLTGLVSAYEGKTPIMRLGHDNLLIFLALFLGLLLIRARRPPLE